LEINNSKTLRINFTSLFLIGSGSLALLFLTLYLLLGNIYGRFELVDIVSAVKQMKFFQDNPDFSAAILYSKYSDDLLNDGSNWYNSNIKTWQKFAKSSGIKLDIIDDKALESGDFQKYQLLVLPTSKALSNGEIIQIKQFLENGGNVFATNSTASFDENRKWRSWNFFNEVFGIKYVSKFSNEKITRKQTFKGGLALTAGIPSGFSLPIATWDSPMACQVIEPRTVQIAFWDNFLSEKNFISAQVENMASIVSGNYGQGKFIWMGFNINSVFGEQEEYIMFEKFIKNSMNWLTKKPIIFVKD
jgi:Beta-galactosidase trimerisation domain